jgi:hypothetical protein
MRHFLSSTAYQSGIRVVKNLMYNPSWEFWSWWPGCLYYVAWQRHLMPLGPQATWSVFVVRDSGILVPDWLAWGNSLRVTSIRRTRSWHWTISPRILPIIRWTKRGKGWLGTNRRMYLYFFFRLQWKSPNRWLKCLYFRQTAPFISIVLFFRAINNRRGRGSVIFDSYKYEIPRKSYILATLKSTFELDVVLKTSDHVKGGI